jgi:hypothetical protein
VGSEVADIAKTGLKGADLNDALVSKLDEFADETLDALNNTNIKPEAGNFINKAIKEGNVDGIPIDEAVIDNTLIDISAKASTKGSGLTFPEVKALWKRGNDFNKKRELDYPNNEVWVTHPSKEFPIGHKNAGEPRKFRLDAYDHVNGYIVSRKATTLSEIPQTTFIKYLDELLGKYPVGSKISRSGIGSTLQGKFRLEIPNINENFPNLQAYRELARLKGIELILKAE